MKISIIKRHLIAILLLVGCLMLISCQNLNSREPLKKEVTQNTNESNDKENEIDEINKNLKENKSDKNTQLNQDNQDNQVSKENQNNQGGNLNGNSNEASKSEEENSYNKIIGIINDIFIKDNKTYITVDEVEFFRGDAAYNEARKDEKLYKDENGKEFLPNGYYLRNSSSELKTYEVRNDAILKLCIFIVEPNSTVNSAETVVVKYSEFKKYINSTKSLDGRSRMCWISSENNLVNKIEMQYTP